MATYGGFTGATPFKARDAYYRGTFGVSYSQFRTLASKAKPEGLSGEQVRSAARQFKRQGQNPKQSIERLLADKSTAKTSYQSGQAADFDFDYWSDFDLDQEWLWYHG